MKRIVAIVLCLCLCLSCTACGGSSYRVKTVLTLVEQEYSLAFRTGDRTADFVKAAIETLNGEGKVDELAVKWFGDRIIRFERDADALDKLLDLGNGEREEIPQRDLIIGVDVNSFPMAYPTGTDYWGFDVELAMAVCERLGWTLKMQAIEKENVYIELSSGNIDCAWGGVALNHDEVAQGLYAEYGPYVENDIVIAVREGTLINNRLGLNNKKMAMCSTVEAMDALNSDERLAKRLGQVTRLAGGTTECFDYLYTGKCDAVLTDTTAMYYFNSH